MNNNLTTNDMNIEDYEDKALKKSKLAKGIGIAAVGAIGGAAIAAGTAYAAGFGDDDVLDLPLSADEMAQGAEFGDEIQPVDESTVQPATQYVYVEAPEPVQEQETEHIDEPEVVWEDTTNYYIGDQKVMSVEEGTVDGQNFMLVDADGDGHADILAIDANNNHEYDEDEIIGLTPGDNVHMGHETAHTTDNHYDPWMPGDSSHEEQYAYHDESEYQIHNNFEDEKTGESYSDDFAEGNPDYNPHADMGYGNHDEYLADNHGYDEGDHYHAGLHDHEIDGHDDYLADTHGYDEHDGYSDGFDDHDTGVHHDYLADIDGYDGHDDYSDGLDDHDTGDHHDYLADTHGYDEHDGYSDDFDDHDTDDHHDYLADTDGYDEHDDYGHGLGDHDGDDHDDYLADNDGYDDDDDSDDSMMHSEEFYG